DMTSLQEFKTKASMKEQDLLERILKFGVNLNDRINKDLVTQIQSVNKKSKIILNTIYNKILNNKLFLIGLLQEAVLYSMYGYFIVTSFIDSRGRYYLNGYYLNVQNFPLAKVFVKPFIVKESNTEELNDKTL